CRIASGSTAGPRAWAPRKPRPRASRSSPCGMKCSKPTRVKIDALPHRRACMAREIELKLSLPRRSVSALRRHPLLAASAQLGRAVTLDNVYHDTPDLALRKTGVALRIRVAGRRRLQTVKAASASTAGLTSRPEWEQPWSGAFDFSEVDDAHIRALLERHAAALVPVFSTRF